MKITTTNIDMEMDDPSRSDVSDAADASSIRTLSLKPVETYLTLKAHCGAFN